MISHVPSRLRGPAAADLHRARYAPPTETSPPRHPFAIPVLGIGGDGVVTGGRMAEREGPAAAAPERPRRGEACCLSPQGELHASSTGADKLRSSAQLAAARHRSATAFPGTNLLHGEVAL